MQVAERHTISMASRDSEFELEQPKQDELYFPQASQIENDGKVFAESSPDEDMSTSSQHSFGSTEDGFSIRIIENMKEEYGLFVWPSSIILAEYVWQQKSRFAGANVVEVSFMGHAIWTDFVWPETGDLTKVLPKNVQ